MDTIRKALLSILLLFTATATWANYTGSLPYTVSNNQFTVDGYTFSIATGYYQEWDHYVIFWSTGYGKQSGTPTSIGSGNYLLNLTQMKQYAELCYTNYTKVGFLDPTSADGGGHKIIILAYYSTDWFATGSGVKTSSGIWGVLNIAHSSANPSAANPYYTYCHEIGHAYQYLGYAKNGGNAGFNYESGMYGWVSYYECCGNWQAALEYPALYFPQSFALYARTTNLAFTHSWHCYQCYPLNDYLTEKCGDTTIGDIWTINTNVAYAEPLEKYMSKTGCTAEELYRQLFFAAMRMTTWDLDSWRTYLNAEGTTSDKYMDHRVGTKAGSNATSTPQTYSDTYCINSTKSTYQYVTTNSSSAIHQVAYSSAPQSSGFNCIKLNVPAGSDRTVTTTFTALASGASLASGDNKEYWMGSMWAKNSSQSKYNTGVTAQSNTTYNTYKNWRGFRLGYVAYKKNGQVRYYNYTDKVYCTGTSETSANISFDVPEDVDSLYLIVSPALSNYLRNESSGSYDISGSSASEYVSFQQSFDQWPYRVQFYNTNIYGLSNPSTTFSGTADSGTTWITMPDLSEGEEYGAVETTYTIKVASGSPEGAGFTVSSSLKSIGNDQYTTKATITNENATDYITPNKVEGYSASITVSGTAITITYTEKPEELLLVKNFVFPATTDFSGTEYTLTSADLSSIADYLGCTTSDFKNTSKWTTYNTFPGGTPGNGEFYIYKIKPSDGSLVSGLTSSSGNGNGYWMDSNGEVQSYGDGCAYYMEYTISTGVFHLGQLPNALHAGDSCPLCFAILYTNTSGETSRVNLTFNVLIGTYDSPSGNVTMKAYKGDKNSADRIYYATFSNDDVTFILKENSENGGVATVCKAYVTTDGLQMTDLPADVTYFEGTAYSGYFVPASTGVLLKATFSTTSDTDIPYYIYKNRDTDTLSENMLYAGTGSDTAGPDSGSYTFYKLAYGNWTGDADTSTGLGFWWGAADGAAFVCHKGNSFLAVPADMTQAKGFTFDSSYTDGVHEANANASANANANANANVYNILGQRVNGSAKGVLIKNGRKHIVK